MDSKWADRLRDIEKRLDALTTPEADHQAAVDADLSKPLKIEPWQEVPPEGRWECDGRDKHTFKDGYPFNNYPWIKGESYMCPEVDCNHQVEWHSAPQPTKPDSDEGYSQELFDLANEVLSKQRPIEDVHTWAERLARDSVAAGEYDGTYKIDSDEAGDRWWCYECKAFVDESHRCEQWAQVRRIPAEAIAALDRKELVALRAEIEPMKSLTKFLGEELVTQKDAVLKYRNDILRLTKEKAELNAEIERLKGVLETATDRVLVALAKDEWRENTSASHDAILGILDAG